MAILSSTEQMGYARFHYVVDSSLSAQPEGEGMESSTLSVQGGRDLSRKNAVDIVVSRRLAGRFIARVEPPLGRRTKISPGTL